MVSGVTVLILLAALLVTAVWLGLAGHHRSVLRSFDRAAHRLAGRRETVSFWRRPCVVFLHDGKQAQVERVSRWIPLLPRYLRFRIAWPDEDLRCVIRPKRFLGRLLRRLARLAGARGVAVGDSAFDRRYAISGNNAAQIRRLITGGVQSRLDHVRYLHMSDHVQASFSGAELTVRKRGVSDNHDTIYQFAIRCCELYDQAMLVQSSGLTILAESTDPQHDENGPPICRVCGEPIERNRVYCRTCRTPHHRDCWKYFGACSTYGCGQKRFVKRLKSTA